MNALAVMREMPIEGREYCSKLTPKSVLECEHTSSQCETQDKDNIKKRRLSDIRDDQTFQISQVQWC